MFSCSYARTHQPRFFPSEIIKSPSVIWPHFPQHTYKQTVVYIHADAPQPALINFIYTRLWSFSSRSACPLFLLVLVGCWQEVGTEMRLLIGSSRKKKTKCTVLYCVFKPGVLLLTITARFTRSTWPKSNSIMHTAKHKQQERAKHENKRTCAVKQASAAIYC